MGYSNYNLFRELTVADMFSGLAEKEPDVEPRSYGVQLLYPSGWKSLRTFVTGKTKTYCCEEAAIEAAVKAWRRTDRPSRPYRIPNCEIAA